MSSDPNWSSGGDDAQMAIDGGGAAADSASVGSCPLLGGSHAATASSALGGEDDGSAGTPSHKAQRWADYQAQQGNAGWSYERWEKVYHSNLLQASKANAAVDADHKKLLWGKREVTLKVKINDQITVRRLDIADLATQRGIEYKIGYQTANEANLWEVARDKLLVEDDWDITWVFRDTASAPLLEALDNAGIKYIIEAEQ